MKKILVFENQQSEIENTLRYINLKFYNKELDITYYVASQDLGDISNIMEYALIIIDIDLAYRSEKDGIGIISDINSFDKEELKKVLVLTGSPDVRNRLDTRGFQNIKMILKPTNALEMYSHIKEIIK